MLALHNSMLTTLRVKAAFGFAVRAQVRGYYILVCFQLLSKHMVRLSYEKM